MRSCVPASLIRGAATLLVTAFLAIAFEGASFTGGALALAGPADDCDDGDNDQGDNNKGNAGSALARGCSTFARECGDGGRNGGGSARIARYGSIDTGRGDGAQIVYAYPDVARGPDIIVVGTNNGPGYEGGSALARGCSSFTSGMSDGTAVSSGATPVSSGASSPGANNASASNGDSRRQRRSASSQGDGCGCGLSRGLADAVTYSKTSPTGNGRGSHREGTTACADKDGRTYTKNSPASSSGENDAGCSCSITRGLTGSTVAYTQQTVSDTSLTSSGSSRKSSGDTVMSGSSSGNRKAGSRTCGCSLPGGSVGDMGYTHSTPASTGNPKYVLANVLPGSMTNAGEQCKPSSNTNVANQQTGKPSNSSSVAYQQSGKPSINDGTRTGLSRPDNSRKLMANGSASATADASGNRNSTRSSNHVNTGLSSQQSVSPSGNDTASSASGNRRYHPMGGSVGAMANVGSCGCSTRGGSSGSHQQTFVSQNGRQQTRFSTSQQRLGASSSWQQTRFASQQRSAASNAYHQQSQSMQRMQQCQCQIRPASQPQSRLGEKVRNRR